MTLPEQIYQAGCGGSWGVIMKPSHDSFARRAILKNYNVAASRTLLEYSQRVASISALSDCEKGAAEARAIFLYTLDMAAAAGQARADYDSARAFAAAVKA